MTSRRRRRVLVKRVKHALLVVPECLLVVLGLLLIPPLPHCVIVALSRFAGRMASLRCFPWTKMIEYNLRYIYGDRRTEAERRALVREVNTNVVRMVLEVFWFSWFTGSRTRRYVTLDEDFRAILAAPDGALLVTAHIGNWELGALRCAAEGFPVLSVHADFGHSVTNSLMQWIRSHTGCRSVPRAGAAVALLRALHGGDKIALLLDQYIPVRQGGMFSRILGRPAIVSGLVGVLSARRKAKVVSVACVHTGGGRYRFRVYSVLQGDHGMKPEEVTHWIADSLTRQIEDQPGQWFWMYRRWRHVPPGENPADYPPYAVCYKEGRD